MFSVHQLMSYLKYAESKGLNYSIVLPNAGLSEAKFDNSYSYIEDEEGARILDVLAERMPRHFALEHGSQTKHLDFGILGHAALSCHTLEEAMMLWNRYSLIIGNPLKTETKVIDNYWVIELTPRIPLTQRALRFVLEDTIASQLPLGNALSKHRHNPVRYELAIPAPEPSLNYSDWLEAPVIFNAKKNRIVLDKNFQIAPIDSADEMVLAICQQGCSTLLENIMNMKPTAQKIKEILLRTQGPTPTLDEVANLMNTGKRTLSRQLAKEGYTYMELVNDFRRDYTLELLKEGLLHIKKVSYVVGFKSVNSFRRSFKEWTGLTVGEWQYKYKNDFLSPN